MSCFGTRRIKEPDKCVKVATTEALANAFIQPGKEKRVESLGEVVTVVKSTIGVQKDTVQSSLLTSLVLYARVLSRAGGCTPRNSTTMPRTSTFRTTVVDSELDVTKVEDSCNELACLGNVSLG